MLVHRRPGRVLLPRLDNLGDIVMVQGFLRALEELWPAAELHLLVRSHFQDLAPLCSPRLVWHATGLDGYGDPPRPLETGDDLWPLVNAPWDVCLFTAFNQTWLDGALLDVLSARGVECVRLVGRDPDVVMQGGERGGHVVRVDEWSHETEKYRSLLSALGGDGVRQPVPRLSVPSSARAAARTLLDTHSLPERSFVLCVPGGTSNVTVKAWPPDRFAACLRILEQRHGLRSVVVGHRAEAAIVEDVCAQARTLGANPVTWIGQGGDLPLLAGLTAAARIYLGNDTGPMHVASAVETPVVALFGGGHWPRFTPSAGAVVCVAPLPCFGCQWNCMFGDAPCVRLIERAEVDAAMEEALREPARPGVVVRESPTATQRFADRLVADVRELSADRKSKEGAIARLETELVGVRADRSAKQDVIARLETELHAVQGDRSAKDLVIARLETELGAVRADRAAKGDVILRLDAELAEVRGDQFAKATVIARLASEIAEYRSLGWGVVGKAMTAKRLLTRGRAPRENGVVAPTAPAPQPPQTTARATRTPGYTHVALDVLPIEFGVSGGVEVYMKTLVRALTGQKDRVRATLLCHAGQIGALRQSFDEEVEYRILDPRANGHRPAGYTFAGLGESVDILHSPVQIFSSHDYDVPGILNLHDLQHLHFPENFSPAELEARQDLYIRSARRASAIIASSDFVRNDIVGRVGVPFAKVHTIPVACNPEIEEGDRSFTPAQARATYGLPEVFAFYPAQFWIHKNHARLIEALRIVRERAPGTDLKLVLSGFRGHTGWPAAEQALDRHGMRDHVLVLDFIPTAHLAAIYRLATFCVVPSLFEASSYPVIEAQTLGCPAMCSAVTSLPELMAGGAGLVFDPRSPEDMAEKMLRWLADPEDRRVHAERGRQRAKREHSLEAYAGKVLALYDSLVG